jgi:putative spermidine/putrescine transport system ATP-binding protein/putrescine transport system ATP-binding protein
MIAGFEHPDHGTLTIEGTEMRGRRPYERNVGLLFQDYALFPHMTVQENIAYGPRIRRTARGELRERVASLIALTRLSGLEGRRPNELSGGQQQRVALARALATNPQLLLLDEPLSALDAKLRQELQIELKEMLTAIGRTTIIVTHDQDEAMALAERVLVMNQGRIIQDGTPGEIYRRPKTRFVAEFIGRSNWFVGRLGKATSDELHDFHTAGGQRLSLITREHLNGKPIDVCIRPEHVNIDFGDSLRADDPPGTTVLPGRLATVLQIGAFAHFVVEIAPDQRILVVAHDHAERRPPVGAPVSVRFHAGDCILIPVESDECAAPAAS